MKTKKLFLIAVVLLSSVCAFAQSGNSEPLKGDVNGDGLVDVADIAAIIDIMASNGGTATYWYAGQNASDNYITADNYTSIATQSAFTTKTINMTAGNYLYVVVPYDKTVEITDPAGNGVTMNFFNPLTGTYTETPYVATANYYLIRTRATAAIAEAWTVVTSPKTYYWYVGTTKPTSLDQCEVVSEYPAEQTYTNNSGAKSHIFVLTNSDKNVIFIAPSENSPITQMSVDTTTISGYKIFETAVGTANTGSIIIRIS